MLLEGSRERIGEVAGDRRLLGDDEGLHAVHHSERPNRHRSPKMRASATGNVTIACPMVSPFYLIRRRRQLACRARSLPAPRARARSTFPQGGFVLAANHMSNFDPWPLGMPLFPQRQLRFMAKSELFNPLLDADPARRRRLPGSARRGGHRGDADGDGAGARGRDRGHVPGGDAPEEGPAQEARAAGRTRAPRGSRSRRACRSCRPRSRGTDRLGGSARCASPTASRSTSPTSRAWTRSEASERATERLMAEIEELKA